MVFANQRVGVKSGRSKNVTILSGMLDYILYQQISGFQDGELWTFLEKQENGQKRVLKTLFLEYKNCKNSVFSTPYRLEL